MPRARTAEEAAFLALGPGAAAWLVEAAATGVRGVRRKMAEAVALAKLHGIRPTSTGPSGTAALAGRFADNDVLPHPRPPARRRRRPHPGQRDPQPATRHFRLVRVRHHHDRRTTAVTITRLRPVTGAAGDPLAEAIELTRRLKLPAHPPGHGRPVPTAKAQRWDPAEVVRVLLAEEAAGRDQANLRTRRKRAAFPVRQNLRRLGRASLLDPAADPGRAAQPGMGAPQGKRVDLRAVGHRQEPLLRGPRARPRSRPA